jgi:hypothetical protein
MRVRIQSADEHGHTTRFTSIETGQPLNYVAEATIHWRPDRMITAELTQLLPVVDIVAEATIIHVCPCCGQVTPPTQQAQAEIRGQLE